MFITDKLVIKLCDIKSTISILHACICIIIIIIILHIWNWLYFYYNITPLKRHRN